MSQQPRRINTGKANRSTSVQPAAHAAPQHASSTPHRTASAKARKAKKPWWVPLVCVLVVVAVAVGGVAAWARNYVREIEQEIRPEEDAPVIEEVIKTAEEYKGDVVNFLVLGVDYSGEEADLGDGTNDGMTDMIMYVQLDVKNSKMQILQIPRDTIVTDDSKKITCANTTGKTYRSTNYRINSIAKSNRGKEDKSDNFAALADVIANNYRLPIDYYVAIDMDAVKYLVDVFGGLEVYVPTTISFAGSRIEAGLRRLDGNAVEFLARNRKTYANGDMERLNMQRHIYAGLFKLIRTATIPDLVKLAPALVHYVTTDCDIKTIISVALSFLKVDSGDIMICQAPVFGAPQYNGQAILVADLAATADLLNAYFREYTGPVDANQLYTPNIPHGSTSTSPNVQYMGQLDQMSAGAQ